MTRSNKKTTLRLFKLHEFILAHFTKSDWIKVALLTNSVALIENHPRLLRSLDFKDDEYEGNSLQVLSKVSSESTANLYEIERYIDAKKTALNLPVQQISEVRSTVNTGIEDVVAYQSITALQLIDRSRQGLEGTETGRVAGLLGISDKEMAHLLNQSVATFHRQAKGMRLDAATSERLLLLTRLAAHGTTVFQDKGKFTRWLRRPLRLVDSRSPLDLMDSTTGVQLVEDILGRIEYGIFS